MLAVNRSLTQYRIKMVFDLPFFKMRRSVRFNAVACIRLVLGIVRGKKDEASLPLNFACFSYLWSGRIRLRIGTDEVEGSRGEHQDVLSPR